MTATAPDPRARLRLPPWTVRLRLTLLYSGLFLASGMALLVATYLIFRANSGVDLIVPSAAARHHGAATIFSNPEFRRRVREMFVASVARDSQRLHLGLAESGIALAILTIVSVALGWLVAGRVLRPLRTMTATTRQISERNLSQRLALDGPQDELKDLADTVDGLLARLEAHVAEQQRFAANASHELRTPLAISQTLLDVARGDRGHDHDELVERLHAVNARAIELTEALLLLSRVDQGAFDAEAVDLSLTAEQAAETLLPLAEKRGVTLTTAGDAALATGSRALLLQLVSNLVHNAIVHNLPAQGSVRVTTAAQHGSVVLTVENSGERLAPELVATLAEPFLRGSERIRQDHAGVGLGLAIVKRIAQAHDGTLTLAARAEGGLRVTVQLPERR